MRLRPTLRVAAGAAAFAAALTAFVGAAESAAPELSAVPFASVPGWREDDHAAALSTFRAGCKAVVAKPPRRGGSAVDPAALVAACRAAALVPAGDRQAARRFFEARFEAVRVGAAGSGFVTGYFEPEVAGSLIPGGTFRTPLYRLPEDVVPVAAGKVAGLPKDVTAARRRSDGGLEPYPDRQAIEAGALAGRGLELVWLADPVDAFFIHVQGSARIRLPDGEILRIGFAGRNGQPYTPVGRLLIERGEIAREEMTADRLAAWLRAHPDEAPALMAANRSFIFFRRIEGAHPAAGPVGSLGVPLTPGRSLAVDPKANPLGVPVFVAAELPADATGGLAPFRRLLVAQDTGAAIRGPARGDIFLGSGAAAGSLAGLYRHPATLFVLVPRKGGADGR